MPGTVWLPIPRHLAETGLDLEVMVFHYLAGSSQTEPLLLRLDVQVRDCHAHAEGQVFVLEPRYWDDPDLPPGYASGRFEVIADLGLVGTVDKPDRFLCLLACIST